MYEAIGSSRYSRPSLYDLDRKLERHLDFDRGFFVEAGANDGFKQSNTYYFEKLRGWEGVLVEPIPALASECRGIRKGPVIEAALVATEEPGKTVELRFAGLMSTMTGAFGDRAAESAHVERGLRLQNLPETYSVEVPARTLSSILDELGVSRNIDLLSLDIEGAEPQALQGLDFTRHAPRYICVETRDRRAIETILYPRYRLTEVLTDLENHQDLLFQLA